MAPRRKRGSREEIIMPKYKTTSAFSLLSTRSYRWTIDGDTDCETLYVGVTPSVETTVTKFSKHTHTKRAQNQTTTMFSSGWRSKNMMKQANDPTGSFCVSRTPKRPRTKMKISSPPELLHALCIFFSRSNSLEILNYRTWDTLHRFGDGGRQRGRHQARGNIIGK